MDERKIEAPPQQRPTAPVEHPHPDSRTLSRHGSELRIDSPHVPANIGEPAVATSTPPISTPASLAPASMTSAPVIPRANSQLLLEAGRILEQLQVQDADLAERQALLEERQAAFEAEKRLFHSRWATDDAILEERRLKLKSDEAVLAQRLGDTQTILAKIDAARLAVEQERADIERRRAAQRDELLTELQQDRQAIDADRRELAQEFERARALTASLDERLRETTAEAERLIQAERERLWQTLIAEWDERRAQFQTDHDAWLAAVQAEKVEIEREKAFYEAAVRNAETDFAAARLEQEAELQALRASEIAALQAERANLFDKIQTEREEWEDALSEHDAQFKTAREQQATVLQTEREQHLESLLAERSELQAERYEWDKIRSTQSAELQGERAVLENRIRFQQEHLEKLRADLDRAQNEHRRDRQVERQRLEDDSRQIVRRMRQIDLYRASIDEREKSLERERDVLEKSRRAFSSSADVDRLTLQREQSAWQAERQIQQSELLRQQELYSSHADGLESRRIRLEKLRTELEDTHRSTLEMRLAVEEAWVELTQAAGQEAARQRVEQVRNTLVGYYRQLHEGIVEQRRDHLESQTKFERLRAEFHDERQKLMEWISTCDQELRVGEERLRLSAADAATRDAAWQAARDRWMREKAEAEQVIRKLLAELGNQHRDPLMALPTGPITTPITGPPDAMVINVPSFDQRD